MKLEGEKVLVTGGAGFIGSHISERLVRDGASVIVLDNFSTGKLTNLEHLKDDIEIIRCDVENYGDVLKAIKGCNIVIHEAFPYGKSGMGLDEQYIEAGAVGTFNVLKASVKNDVEKVVYASTVSVYGIAKHLPIDEEHPINPFLPYGATKYVGELYSATFSKLYGLDTVILRYFFVYGPRYAQFGHNAMVNFLHRVIRDKPLLIYGGGSQIRDYTYIDDAVDGTLLAMKKEKTQGGVYNISSGEGITILELAEKVVEITGKDIEIRFADSSEYRYSDSYCAIPIGMTSKRGNRWIDERNYVGDISKAKIQLGYNPSVSLEEGIKRTLEWLQKVA